MYLQLIFLSHSQQANDQGGRAEDVILAMMAPVAATRQDCEPPPAIWVGHWSRNTHHFYVMQAKNLP